MDNKKITLTTLKKFIRDNQDNLFIKSKYSFDGMIDGIRQNSNPIFEPIKKDNRDYEYTLQHTQGILGCWLVLGSRDYFTYYNNNEYEGIEVDNSCGNFIVAKKLNKNN
jgi:hypothetical protein